MYSVMAIHNGLRQIFSVLFSFQFVNEETEAVRLTHFSKTSGLKVLISEGEHLTTEPGFSTSLLYDLLPGREKLQTISFEGPRGRGDYLRKSTLEISSRKAPQIHYI
jgi:hypothetical protein